MSIWLPQSSSIYIQVCCLETKQREIYHLQEELPYVPIEEQLKKSLYTKENSWFEQVIKREICSDLLNGFWNCKKHIVFLSYEKDLDKKNIPTKSRPTLLYFKFLDHCKKEIQSLLDLLNPNGVVLHFSSIMRQKRNEELPSSLLTTNLTTKSFNG